MFMRIAPSTPIACAVAQLAPSEVSKAAIPPVRQESTLCFIGVRS